LFQGRIGEEKLWMKKTWFYYYIGSFNTYKNCRATFAQIGMSTACKHKLLHHPGGWVPVTGMKVRSLVVFS